MEEVIGILTGIIIIISWIIFPNSLINFFSMILIGGLGILITLWISKYKKQVQENKEKVHVRRSR